MIACREHLIMKLLRDPFQLLIYSCTDFIYKTAAIFYYSHRSVSNMDSSFFSLFHILLTRDQGLFFPLFAKKNAWLQGY